MVRSTSLVWLSCALALAAGCEEPPPDPASSPPPGSSTVTDGADPVPSVAADAPRYLRRLTRHEFERSLRAVLGPVPVDDQEPDLHRAGMARVGAREIATGTRGVERFDLAVEQAVAQVFDNPGHRDALVNCGVAGPACVDQFIATVGQRAWRRPLTVEERTRYRALHQACEQETGDFHQGLRCVTSGLLHSPHFLYRVELPTNGVYAGYAMASRLAYFLWSSPPDSALLQAAYAGELDTAEGVQAQARRMLESPKAREGFATFVDEWFRTDQLERLERDFLAQTQEPLQFHLGRQGTLQPWLAWLRFAAEEELRQMVVHHVFDEDRDYLDLLITDRTYVDPQLAAFYELASNEEEAPPLGTPVQPRLLQVEGEPDGLGFRRAHHAPDSPRRGLLGTVAVLAQLGKQNETSPTRRGLFIMRKFLCLEVGEPPDDIDLCERPNGVSRRASIEQHHLCAPACKGCHDQMDPLGFAMDRFDTIGRFRGADDWGYEIDSRVEWTLVHKGQSQKLQFDSLRTMGETFYQTDAATECVTKQIFRYGTGREEGREDAQAIADLTAAFRADGRKMKAFLVHFVGSDAFRVAPAGTPDAEPAADSLALIASEVFEAHCSGCHIGAALGGLNLANDGGLASRLQAASVGVAVMPLVTPGDPQNSYLFHKLAGTHANVGGAGDTMPPSHPLSAAELARVEAWIAGGAL